MSNLGRAIELAASVHKNQTDKAGEDYILHPLAVMQMVAEHGRDGVLHDSFEDIKGTPKEKQAFKHTVLTEFGEETLLTGLPGQIVSSSTRKTQNVTLHR